MKSINEILKDYTAGEAELEETNAALKEAGASFHLEPGKNEITEDERYVTVVGYYPEQANGYGLLDTGTGSLDKVPVASGRLLYDVNEVLPDGTANMPAYVTICGKRYQVLGDKLAELPAEAESRREPLPDKADLSRNTDLAGRMADQYTKSGTYRITYDMQGYAIRAVKLEVQP